MSLGKSLTLGDAVYFIQNATGRKVTAIVTGITPSGDNARWLSLTVLPSGGTPFAASVNHASFAGLGADAWDFLDAAATVAL